jgi:hypothetical protein
MEDDSMIICYSSREISVIASREELVALSSLIRNTGGTMASNQTGSPAPYDKLLAAMVVEHAPGQSVRFSVTADDNLRVAGDKKKMEILAKNVESFAKESPDNHHSHEEYFPGHFYLAPDSFPVVFEFSSGVANQKFSTLQ